MFFCTPSLTLTQTRWASSKQRSRWAEEPWKRTIWHLHAAFSFWKGGVFPSVCKHTYIQKPEATLWTLVQTLLLVSIKTTWLYWKSNGLSGFFTLLCNEFISGSSFYFCMGTACVVSHVVRALAASEWTGRRLVKTKELKTTNKHIQITPQQFVRRQRLLKASYTAQLYLLTVTMTEVFEMVTEWTTAFHWHWQWPCKTSYKMYSGTTGLEFICHMSHMPSRFLQCSCNQISRDADSENIYFPPRQWPEASR